MWTGSRTCVTRRFSWTRSGLKMKTRQESDSNSGFSMSTLAGSDSLYDSLVMTAYLAGMWTRSPRVWRSSRSCECYSYVNHM